MKKALVYLSLLLLFIPIIAFAGQGQAWVFLTIPIMRNALLSYRAYERQDRITSKIAIVSGMMFLLLAFITF